MITILAFFVGAAAGFIVGFLFFRNNSSKLQKAEKEIVDIAGKFK